MKASTHKISPNKDRHVSGTGMKGAPKKGGGGGKGTWGIGGIDDLKANPNTKDPNDPNYDSEDEVEVVLEATEVTSPIEAVIQEYFQEGDLDEAARSLEELKIDDIHQEFVKKAIIFAMEKQPYERELISKLLCELYGKVITPEKISHGFQRTLDSLEDIVLDVPDASDMLAKFLARAIVDEIVPPAFLKNTVPTTNIAKDTIALANALITERHRMDRLAHIWGPGDLSSVKRLKEEAATMIEEFLTTGDLQEVDACIRKLNASEFHFQLVKIAIRMVLTRTEEDRRKIVTLFDFLFKSGHVGPETMAKGFNALYDQIDDIKLDIPNASSLVHEFVEIGRKEGWLSSKYQPPVKN